MKNKDNFLFLEIGDVGDLLELLKSRGLKNKYYNEDYHDYECVVINLDDRNFYFSIISRENYNSLEELDQIMIEKRGKYGMTELGLL